MWDRVLCWEVEWIERISLCWVTRLTTYHRENGTTKDLPLGKFLWRRRSTSKSRAWSQWIRGEKWRADRWYADLSTSTIPNDDKLSSNIWHWSKVVKYVDMLKAWAPASRRSSRWGGRVGWDVEGSPLTNDSANLNLSFNLRSAVQLCHHHPCVRTQRRYIIAFIVIVAHVLGMYRRSTCRLLRICSDAVISVPCVLIWKYLPSISEHETNLRNDTCFIWRRETEIS